MSTRSVLGLMYTVQSLRQLGESTASVLARYGLNQDKLDPNSRIDRTLELKINIELAEQLRDPLAGLKTGRVFGFTGFGPLGMLYMTCADARQAFEMGIRYQQLTYLYSTLRFESGEKLSALTLELMPLAPKAFRFRMDMEMSGTHKLLGDVGVAIGTSFQPDRVDMPYPRPPEAKSYEDHFGCPVRFGRSDGRFWISTKYFQVPFPTRDPTAHALYQGLCEQQILLQQKSLDTLSEKVVQHLDLFQNALPDAARVADFFGLPERSFRRKLSEEGTSYRELVNNIQYRRAQHLLRNTKLSVEAIATQLGYAETAAFTHAFQRWAGTTPLAFRTAR